MSFIPEEELKGRSGLNLTPMIDFLFLMMMFFACLAVSRVMTKDTDIELVELKPDNQPGTSRSDYDRKIINISINSEGKYKWVTDIRDYSLENEQEIAEELLVQYEKGILPENKELTQVLLRIDKKTNWEPILKAIFAIRDAGFDVRPVYEPINQA